MNRIAAVIFLYSAFAVSASAEIPTPTVTGPIPSPGTTAIFLMGRGLYVRDQLDAA